MTVKPAPVVQLGLGAIGRALVATYLDQAAHFPQIHYLGVGDRSGLWLAHDAWPAAGLRAALEAKASGVPLSRWRPDVFGAELVPPREAYTPDLLWRLDELGIRRAVVVDTAGPTCGSGPLLAALRRAGYDVVLANRTPLAGPLAAYDALARSARGRLRYEAAIGAALPLQEALAQVARGGRPLAGIVAMPSPALGLILDAVRRGRRFSEAVGEAQARGLLHSDPREDLCGQDPARTALLLARGAGWRLEPEALRVQGLLPPGFAASGPGEFWARVGERDAPFAEQAWLAGERGHVLRFLARLGPQGGSVRVEEVPGDSTLGRLAGTDTFFALYPTEDGGSAAFVRGPGGPAATAAAVFADILGLT